MVAALALCLAAIVAASALLLHYEVLRLTLILAPRPGWPVRVRMVSAVGALLLAHGGAIAFYGIAEWAVNGSLGGFDGTRPPQSFGDHLYVSAISYACVGFGDAYPVGAMRALVAVESLNGLVLIGWSATFAYLLMQRLWLEDPATRERVLGQAPLQAALLHSKAPNDPPSDPRAAPTPKEMFLS